MKKLLVIIIMIFGLFFLYIQSYKNEERFFYASLSRLEPYAEAVLLKDVVNFDWDYACGLYSYEMYDKHKIEEIVGFKFDGEIPKSYGSSEGDALLIFINKENKSIKTLNADKLILSDETKKICNDKTTLKLFLTPSSDYMKAWYILKYKFILKN